MTTAAAVASKKATRSKSTQDMMYDIMQTVLSGSLETKKAQEITNAMGKLIKTVQLEMDYQEGKKKGKYAGVEFFDTKQ